MKILFALSRFPYPLLTGDRLRAFHQLRVLSQHHEITLVCPPPEAEADLDRLRPFLSECNFVPISAAQRVIGATKGLVRGEPAQVRAFCPPTMAQIIGLAASQHELVHLQLSRLGPALGAIRKSAPGKPVLVDFVDSLAMNLSRRAEKERGPKRAAIRFEAERLRRYERWLAVRANAAVAISAADCAEIGIPETQVVPNGIELPPWVDRPAPTDPVIALTGNMGYFPNVDASVWFVTEIWSGVRAALPNAQLRLVGAAPSREVEALARHDGVTVTGRVESIENELRNASVAIAPMRTGSGMQNKVLEAMAVGTPVVLTPVVAAGLGAPLAGSYAEAVSPQEFAAAVVGLIQNREDARARARRAYDALALNYRWESTVQALERHYQALGD